MYCVCSILLFCRCCGSGMGVIGLDMMRWLLGMSMWCILCSVNLRLLFVVKMLKR